MNHLDEKIQKELIKKREENTFKFHTDFKKKVDQLLDAYAADAKMLEEIHFAQKLYQRAVDDIDKLYLKIALMNAFEDKIITCEEELSRKETQAFLDVQHHHSIKRINRISTIDSKSNQETQQNIQEGNF